MNRTILWLLVISAFILAGIGYFSLSTYENHAERPIEIKGITYAAPPFATSDSVLQDLQNRTSANYIALVPYAFSRQDQLVFNKQGQWRGETVEGVQECIRAARKAKLKILLKPQVWRRGGEFTGDINFTSEKEWRRFEKSYQDYILQFARLAESEKVEMFSIGNEFKNFVEERPEYWQDLINKVKQLYSGKLIYAANWDNYNNIPFWQELDYIGINSYFPLCDMKTPTLSCLAEGWEKVNKEIEQVSNKYNKEVILTEFGYRNIDFAASKPWESYSETQQNDSAQMNALNATFEIMESSPTIIGGFLWKWELPFRDEYRKRNDFTIQGKMAEKVVKESYGKLESKDL